MAGPAYTVEAHGGGTGGSTTIVSNSQTWTTGRRVTAFSIWDDGTSVDVTSMTQSGGAITWTSKIAKFTDGRHGQSGRVYEGSVDTGFTGTITANINGTGAIFRDLQVAEYSSANSTQYDATATDVLDAGTAVDVAITTTQADCLVIGHNYNDSGSGTWTSNDPAGMTTIANYVLGQAICTNYRTTNPGSGAATVDFTLSNTDETFGVAVAIAPTGGGATAVVNPFVLPLMGIQ